MLLSAKDLFGAAVYGTEGELGKLRDFFFDFERWQVRYLVIDSGQWLNGRRILLTPRAIHSVSEDRKGLNVGLSQDMVRNSPDFSGERSISREQEVLLHNYYRWPFYWEDNNTITGSGVVDVPLIELTSEVQAELAKQQEGNANLRPAGDVIGLQLEARDGELGKVDDFIFDDQNLRIAYMVVTTGGWLSGRRVLVSPSFIKSIHWNDSQVEMDLSQETIRNSPEYDPGELTSPDFEIRMNKLNIRNRGQ